jgi:tetratricopeptide (TPR) repeat protein
VSLHNRTLHHAAFFEALAGMEEGSTAWPATAAGLVVLRLVESWLEEGTAVAAADGWSLRAAREAVDEVSPMAPTRAILAGVLDAIAAHRPDLPAAVGVVAPRLMAYGRALDFEGHLRLAADVYRTLVAHAHPAEEPDVAIDASMQLGYCLRRLGDLDAAAAAYAQAGGAAEASGDLMKVLLAQAADAKIAVARGNLPRAEAILDRTIEAAAANHFSELHGITLHERATVAHLRGDYERAVRIAYESLGKLQSQVARDRVLGDLAASFIHLGVRSAARDALMILAATAQDQYSRWVATINLMELEAMDGCEPRFEEYRRQLDGLTLPPVLQAEYYYSLGEAHRIFQHPDQARQALTRAMEVATAHGLNEHAFRAEQALAELEVAARQSERERRAAQRVAPATAAPETLSDVVTALGRMRATVDAGGGAAR